MSNLSLPFGNSTAPKTGYKSVELSDSAFPDLEESNNPFTEVEEPTSTEIGLYRFNATSAQPQLMLYTSMLDTAKLRATIRRNALVIVDKKVNNWWSVHTCGFSGWSYVADIEGNMEVVKEVQRHEDWQGNNYFFLNGRVMIGSDGKLFLFTNALILVPSVFFFMYTLPSLYPYLKPSTTSLYTYVCVVAFVYSVAIFMYVHLWITATLDPGILPRQPKHAKPNPPSPLIKSMQLTLNEHGEVDSTQLVGWKWCSTCNIYRPPRSKHCKACQNCVLHFDHHCPWTGGCIGSRNYKHFFFFLTSCSLYCVLVLTLSTFSLIQTIIHEDEKDPHGISGEDKIMDAVTDSPAAVIAIILTFALGWGLMSLLSYHCWLLSIGQTTNEQLTNVYSEENAERNPYDHGCCGNTQLMMCKEMDESLLPDMSEMMTATEYIDTHYPVTVT